MKQIPIGNDIPFEWSIFRDGVPEDFSRSKTELFLLHPYAGKIRLAHNIINGNVVRGCFRGKDQFKTGVYTMILVENGGGRNMNRFDIKCWKLVESSYELMSSEEVLQFSTDIVFPANGIGIKSITTTQSSDDEGYNTITINLDSGESTTFRVKNGSKGDKGDKGEQGEQGVPGLTQEEHDALVNATKNAEAIANAINGSTTQKYVELDYVSSGIAFFQLMDIPSGSKVEYNAEGYMILRIEDEGGNILYSADGGLSFSFVADKDYKVRVVCDRLEGDYEKRTLLCSLTTQSILYKYNEIEKQVNEVIRQAQQCIKQLEDALANLPTYNS